MNNYLIEKYLGEAETKNLDKAVEMFVKGAQKKIDDYFKKEFPSQTPDKLSIQNGRSYIRIVRTTNGGKGSAAAWAFIDKREGSEGDILKAASWKAPAKGKRGTVYDNSYGVNFVGPYGPAYFR